MDARVETKQSDVAEKSRNENEISAWRLLTLAGVGAVLTQAVSALAVSIVLNVLTSDCVRGTSTAVAGACYQDNSRALLAGWLAGAVVFTAAAILVLVGLMTLKQVPFDKDLLSIKASTFLPYGVGVSFAQVVLWMSFVGAWQSKNLIAAFSLVAFVCLGVATAKVAVEGIVDSATIKYALKAFAFIGCVTVVLGVTFALPLLHP